MGLEGGCTGAARVRSRRGAAELPAVLRRPTARHSLAVVEARLAIQAVARRAALGLQRHDALAVGGDVSAGGRGPRGRR